jgi:hypothetical protein
MSLDATESKLTRYGEVILHLGGDITVSGFDGENCTCRDVATLALVYAIGRLQEELMWQIMKPGGSGKVGVA